MKTAGLLAFCATMSCPLISMAQDHKIVGLDLSGGTPYGIGTGIAVNPTAGWLRLNGGITWNSFNLGLKGGATLDPFSSPVSVALTLEGGHQFEMDLSSILDKRLPSFDYNYLSFMPGIEIGGDNRRDHFSFYTRIGISWMWFNVHQINRIVDNQNVTVSDPRINGMIPAVQAGFSWLML